MNILTSATVDKGNTPKDILTIRKFLDSFGIEEYEKSTLNFLSEFLNTYITDLLQDAKKNMLFANRNKINIEDVKLAVKSKQNSLYKNRPDISTLKDLAKTVNEYPLPPIPDSPNVLLPPIENNLLRNNFQIFSEELAQYFATKTKKETSTMKPEDMTMLGLKRREFDTKNELKANKKRIRLSVENSNNQPSHKHRKLSLTQAYKPKEEKEIPEVKHEEKDEDDNEDEDDENEENDPIFEKDEEDEDNNNDEYSHEKHNTPSKPTRKLSLGKKKDEKKGFEPFKSMEEDDLNDLDFQ